MLGDLARGTTLKIYATGKLVARLQLGVKFILKTNECNKLEDYIKLRKNGAFLSNSYFGLWME